MSPDSFKAPDFQNIRTSYDLGQYCDAWRLMEALGVPEESGSVQTLILAGRIVGNLEGERRALLLHTRAWRKGRGDAEAAYYRGHVIRSRLGPLRALRFLEQLPEFPDADLEIRASLLSQRAVLLSVYRDFSGAGKLLGESEALGGKTAWLQVERASVFERADCYAEALDCVFDALSIRPFYRPAVQSAAHLMGLLNRDEEAVSLLMQASERLQSPAVVAQLAAMLREHQRLDEALAMWKRYRDLALLAEESELANWHARMADVNYDLGDLRQAAEHGRLAKNGYHERIAERLVSPPSEAKILKLDVPFVRQHEMTCAPATLSALSRYWNTPVDHLALAREICYDGTQGHRERAWAEANGYIVREFTVTWDSARALLDRGIPFTVATVETTSAHLQAIVGYDSVRGTLFIRDPFLRNHSECTCPGWLEEYAFCGPRGMALVPAGHREKLSGLALEDEALMDELYALERGLHEHDRQRAAAAIQRLEHSAPGHRILFQARRILAWYDGDQPRALAATEEWLRLFPAARNLQWSRYHGLRDLARREDHRTLLEEMARSKNSEPLFWRELGDEMRVDARHHAMSRRWLIRVLRYQPVSAENLFSMAGQLWDEQRFADALPLYRLAAHLRDKVSYIQRAWFSAARHFNRSGEVLAVFRERFTADRELSAEPAMILHDALVRLERTPEAINILEEALAARPDDGELLTFSADVHARYGNYEKAAELIARAEGKSPRRNWLRSCATLADYRSDLHESLRLWREILADSPLAFDAIRTIARLTAETEGRAAANEFLAKQVLLFPHHLPLRELQVDWLRDDGPEAQQPMLKALLEMAPHHTWAHREQSLALQRLQRFDEALAHADASIAAEPREAGNYYTRGRVLFAAGRIAESADAYREALRRSVDHSSSIDGLLSTCQTFDERKTALAFILQELQTQVVFGDGLFSYLSAAFPILEPGELLENLRGAHAARPDLWHAWSVLITCLCDAKRAAEALPIARESVERFPLNARLWMDLALVHLEQRHFDENVAALRRACELAPTWSRPRRALAEGLQRCEQYDEAERVMEATAAAAPLDAVNRGYLAEFKWRRRRDAKSLVLLEEAIRLDPGYGWAWDALKDWSANPERAVELARELTTTRGGEAASWLKLATMLPDSALEERLSLLNRATALDPLFTDAHDTRIWILAGAGRYDDAAAACTPAAYGGSVPRGLRARSAWVKSQRGNFVGAIAEMNEIVAAEPDFYWAWDRLAHWNARIGEFAAERDSAERMARLDPRNPVPLGYLAEAEFKLGNRDKALVVLERAFALDPTYEYAAFKLFDSHLDKQETKLAAEKLEKMRIHIPGPETTAAEVRLLAMKGERATAVDRFLSLLNLPERDSGALETAGGAIRAAGWHRELEAAIFPHLPSEMINPQAGSEWVLCIMALGKWRKRKALWKLEPDRNFTRTAWRTFISECGEKKEYRYVREMIKRFGLVLRSDDSLWAAVGYALSVCDKDRAAMDWMSDWRARADLRPWILTNYAASARICGAFHDAMDAHRHALTLRHDHTYPQHILWIALSELDAGGHQAAGTRLAEMRYEMLDTFCKSLWTLAEAVCRVNSAENSVARQAYRDAMARLNLEEHRVLKKDRFLRRIARRLVAQMAARAKLKFSGLRGWWFSFVDL
jgi:cellulose synthase operon protein C